MDTNELENIIVDHMIGNNPMGQSPGELTDKVNLFVTWCFKSDDIKKKLREKHQIEWDIVTQDSNHVEWIVHYQGFLIKQIRDMRINSILND